MNFKQPLEGEFHLSYQLFRINQQLSGFKNKYTIPCHCLSLFYLLLRLPLGKYFVNNYLPFIFLIYFSIHSGNTNELAIALFFLYN
jgi:hypothetical protein